MAKRHKGRWSRLPMAMHLVGLASAFCIVWAVWGLLQAYGVFTVPQEVKTAIFAAPQAKPKSHVVTGSVAHKVKKSDAGSHYPLEVGRYWVYHSEDQANGVVTELARQIQRKERWENRDVFIFTDGTMAYRQDGKIFEIGDGGGVNVVPLGLNAPRRPYVYRSQGLHIEKHISAVDTFLVVEGRRYEACIEVITRFRPIEQDDSAVRAYSSYYARGIGLVGREKWPRSSRATPSMVLQNYGVQSL